VYEQGCAGQDGCPNLTSDVWCQCNYDLYYQDGYGIDYGAWVDQWIYGDVAGIYPDKEYGFNAPGNTQNAPSFYLDQSICWMSNPRDMIMLQNAIWLRRYEWSACASGGTSQNCEPETDFYATSSDNPSQFDINSTILFLLLFLLPFHNIRLISFFSSTRPPSVSSPRSKNLLGVE